MNQLEREFDEAIKVYGGIYIPKENDSIEDLGLIHIKKNILKFIKDIKLRTKSNTPDINVQFVNNNTINASAFKYNNNYHIGLFKGCILGLKDIVDQVFSYEEIRNMNIFGDYTIEEKKGFLYSCMIKFLVAHEYKHISNGHTDLISSLEMNELMEFQKITDSEKAMYTQVLEFDADSCAISAVINDMMIRVMPNIDLAKIYLVYIYLAIYLVFRMFGQGIDTMDNYNFESLEKTTHPNQGIRQTYTAATLSTLLINAFGEKEASPIVANVINACFEIEKIINDDLEIKKILIAIGTTDEAKKHLDKIINLWKKEVRNMLLPYAYDDLPE